MTGSCGFGFPAYAGIDLDGAMASRDAFGLPRLRGDRPRPEDIEELDLADYKALADAFRAMLD